jgi:thioesterase domain-containing protein
MELLAQRVSNIIEKAYPHGPCLLAGWSFGGTLAYATARALQERGRNVQFVGLIDARILSNNQTNDKKSLCEFFVYMLKDELSYLNIHTPTESNWQYLESLAHSGDFSALWNQARQFEFFQHFSLSNLHLPCDEIQRFCKRQKANYDAIKSYHPPASDFPLYLYQASEQPDQPLELDPYYGWDRVIPKNKIVRTLIPGNHHSMLEKDGALAAALTAHILAVTAHRSEEPVQSAAGCIGRK